MRKTYSKIIIARKWHYQVQRSTFQPEKIADIQFAITTVFPAYRTSEKRAQNFHTDQGNSNIQIWEFASAISQGNQQSPSQSFFGCHAMLRDIKKKPKTRSPKTTAKLIHNNVHCFFITIFRLAIPAFFRFTDVTEFVIGITILYLDGECRNKNCLKERGRNDVQHKKKRKTYKDID